MGQELLHDQTEALPLGTEAPVATSVVDQLPTHTRERIIALRGRGWGAKKIYDELPEIAAGGTTPRALESWIYRSLENPVVQTDKLGLIADLLERSGIDPAD